MKIFQTFWSVVAVSEKFDGSKVKVLAKQITRTVGMYEGGMLGQGATRIILESLLDEIKVEVEKLKR